MTDAGKDEPGLSWHLQSEREVYDGFARVASRRYRMPNGAIAEWDVVGTGRSVGVLALTHDGLVVTARQFRAGPGMLLDELPGGGVEPDEDVVDAAARELEEETGYVAEAITVVGRTWAVANNRMEQFVAVASGCRPSGVPSPDPFEFIEVRLKGVTEFVAQVRSGALTDVGLAYLALDHLGLITLRA